MSERCLGFKEKRGGAQVVEHRYGPGSPHALRPLNRFFETTGVCWYFPDPGLYSQELASRVADAFCVRCSVEMRDIGVGLFHAKVSPLGTGKYQGLCVYDGADGSLRLTQRLAEQFSEVVGVAAELAMRGDTANQCLDPLRLLAMRVEELVPRRADGPTAEPSDEDGDWVLVVAPGQRAVYLCPDGTVEVEVLRCRHTPHGLGYDLVPERAGTKWWVPKDSVQPIHGATETVWYNPVTDETRSSA